MALGNMAYKGGSAYLTAASRPAASLRGQTGALRFLRWLSGELPGFVARLPARHPRCPSRHGAPAAKRCRRIHAHTAPLSSGMQREARHSAKSSSASAASTRARALGGKSKGGNAHKDREQPFTGKGSTTRARAAHTVNNSVH